MFYFNFYLNRTSAVLTECKCLKTESMVNLWTALVSRAPLPQPLQAAGVPASVAAEREHGREDPQTGVSQDEDASRPAGPLPDDSPGTRADAAA